jgi:L,D-transpeptidase YbiS
MADNDCSMRESPRPLRDFPPPDRRGRLCYRDRAMWWACRRLGVRSTRFILMVSVLKQQVRLFEQARPMAAGAHPCYVLRKRFRASTSRRGTGQDAGSNRTPLGLHRIGEKIGAGQPVGTVFESRHPVGLTWQGRPDAAIAHRILWLEGLEPGFNRGGAVDSHTRYIYIHGVADEPSLGRPASRGCIHLAASDLMPLFDLLPEGTLVWIAP